MTRTPSASHLLIVSDDDCRDANTVKSKEPQPGRSATELRGIVEVTGQMSRTEWETLYLVVKKMAKEHGLVVDTFDLKATLPTASGRSLDNQWGNQASDGNTD